MIEKSSVVKEDWMTKGNASLGFWIEQTDTIELAVNSPVQLNVINVGKNKFSSEEPPWIENSSVP